MPEKDPGGFLVTPGLGAGRAQVATFLRRHIGWYPTDESAGFVAGGAGAIIVFAACRLIDLSAQSWKAEKTESAVAPMKPDGKAVPRLTLIPPGRYPPDSRGPLK